MMEPHLRAGDSDRAAVAAVLGRHMAEGRLTVAEYDERVARAYAARTYGDLGALTADLPPTDAVRPASPASAPAVSDPAPTGSCGARPVRGRDVTTAWAAWRRVAIIVVGIWAVTSLAAMQFTYFWPIWVVGPWGAMLLSHTIGGGRRPRQRT